MVEEIWKPVEGFPRYEVSNLGRLRSFAGAIPRIMKTEDCIIPNGYIMVNLGRRNTFLLHRLVLTTFVGPCPEGYVAHHKNGIRNDPHLSNLEWIPQWRNNTRVNEKDVRKIRELAKKMYQKDIAARFNISSALVSEIVNYKLWKDVK